MQHTEKYQLNLIEKTDTFSPDALNENMEKVEEKLAALRTDVDGKAPASQADSLEERVAVLEAKKIVAGKYIGNGSTLTLELGFTPRAVLAQCPSYGFCGFATAEQRGSEIQVVENGFQVNNGGSNPHSFVNPKGGNVNFIAFA